MVGRSKVLLVEDDHFLGDSMKRDLLAVYDCDWCKSLSAALNYLKSNNPDVIVSDFMLGSEKSFSILEYLRDTNSKIPFVAISGCVDKESAIQFLNFRTTYLLEKPFEMAKLHFVLQSALESQGSGRMGDPVLGLEIDLIHRRVIWKKKDVSLTSIEFKILVQIFSHRGRSISREKLEKSIWGVNRISRNLLNTHFMNLRKKLPCLDLIIRVQRGHLIVKGANL